MPSVPYGPRTANIIALEVEADAGLLYMQGGTPRADAEAGADAWHALLQCLQTACDHRRWRGGRPRISREVRALLVRMSRENFLWGAPRIHGEPLKLGFVVSQATVSVFRNFAHATENR